MKRNSILLLSISLVNSAAVLAQSGADVSMPPARDTVPMERSIAARPDPTTQAATDGKVVVELRRAVPGGEASRDSLPSSRDTTAPAGGSRLHPQDLDVGNHAESSEPYAGRR